MIASRKTASSATYLIPLGWHRGHFAFTQAYITSHCFCWQLLLAEMFISHHVYNIVIIVQRNRTLLIMMIGVSLILSTALQIPYLTFAPRPPLTTDAQKYDNKYLKKLLKVRDNICMFYITNTIRILVNQRKLVYGIWIQQ